MVAGWAAVPRLRWLGLLSLAVLGVLASDSSRGCAAGVGLAAHSVPLHCIEIPRLPVALSCQLPLPRSGSAGSAVRLYW
ncbi:MAG: hypothetical protein RLZZ516_1536 [Cyanobacteriota bacterium]